VNDPNDSNERTIRTLRTRERSERFRSRHEGNGAIHNILSAERAEDRAIEEDRKKGIIRARRPVQGDINAPPEQ
jgi:hypothetical protein